VRKVYTFPMTPSKSALSGWASSNILVDRPTARGSCGASTPTELHVHTEQGSTRAPHRRLAEFPCDPLHHRVPPSTTCCSERVRRRRQTIDWATCRPPTRRPAGDSTVVTNPVACLHARPAVSWSITTSGHPPSTNRERNRSSSSFYFRRPSRTW